MGKKSSRLLGLGGKLCTQKVKSKILQKQDRKLTSSCLGLRVL